GLREIIRRPSNGARSANQSSYMTTNREAYEDWHARYEIGGGVDTPWHQMVIKYLQPNRDLIGKRVLEIGCGLGGFACWLAKQPERPDQIVAADFAATAVRKGRAF